MRPSPQGYCPRCDEVVRVVRHWPGWRRAWLAWKVILGGLAFVIPFIAWDMCVMLPSIMLFLAGGGPLRRMATEAPTCARCSLELHDQRAGTGVRVRAYSPKGPKKRWFS